MKDKQAFAVETLQSYNQTRLLSSDIMTGKEFRREKRKSKKQKFSSWFCNLKK